MRKVGAAALVLILTVGILLSACGGESSGGETCPEEKKLLLTQWETYLCTVEDVYSRMAWAFSYGEDFVSADSWDSLLKARAACAAAEFYLRNCPAPEFSVTQEQWDALTAAGIETDAVRMEFLGLQDWIRQQADTMTSLGTMLEQDFMLSAPFSGMGAWLEVKRGILADTAEYLCLMTNYMLVQMEETDLWEELPERCPFLAQAQGQWSDDLKGLMARGDQSLDRFAERIGMMQTYAGLQEYSLQITREALETGNLQNLEQELHLVSGLPAFFPDPGWIGEDAERYYLMTDPASGEKLPLEVGDDLTSTPSACYISCPGVARAEVEAYGALLKEWGFSTTTEWKETEASFVVFANYLDSVILVEWTQEETLVYLPEPVACLIPNLYLMALALE